jgi:hypothetical protein
VVIVRLTTSAPPPLVTVIERRAAREEGIPTCCGPPSLSAVTAYGPPGTVTVVSPPSVLTISMPTGAANPILASPPPVVIVADVVARFCASTGDPLEHLTQRERDLLALMAEGRSNAEIGAALVITDSAVSKHINSIFAKLGLYPGDTGHRRVLAVLRYLGAGPAGPAVLSAVLTWPIADPGHDLSRMPTPPSGSLPYSEEIGLWHRHIRRIKGSRYHDGGTAAPALVEAQGAGGR